MKTGLQEQKGLDFDACYLGLGRTRSEREARYKAWVQADVSQAEVRHIREALQYGHPTGSERFKDEIEKKLGIRLALNKRGRPKKTPDRIEEGRRVYGIH